MKTLLLFVIACALLQTCANVNALRVHFAPETLDHDYLCRSNCQDQPPVHAVEIPADPKYQQ